MERLNATLVSGNIFGSPGDACDETHRRAVSTRQVATRRMNAAKPDATCTRVVESKYPACPIVARRLTQGRDIELVHELASLAGVATLEGRKIPKAHADYPVYKSYVPGVEHEVPRTPGLPGGFMPLVPFRPSGKHQFQQVEGHGKRPTELPLRAVTGLA